VLDRYLDRREIERTECEVGEERYRLCRGEEEAKEEEDKELAIKKLAIKKLAI
jgi:hypothetical protein